MRIIEGDPVLIVLHTPREKQLGILDEISPAGVTVRSIDLSYFDDWCRGIASDESFFGLADNFFPMWRIERISRDETSEEIPSMAEQFEKRTGRIFSQQ